MSINIFNTYIHPDANKKVGEVLLSTFLSEGKLVKEFEEMIAKAVKYSGKILFDASKPDGTLQKLLDCSKIKNLGWSPEIKLNEGIEKNINHYE